MHGRINWLKRPAQTQTRKLLTSTNHSVIPPPFSVQNNLLQKKEKQKRKSATQCRLCTPMVRDLSPPPNTAAPPAPRPRPGGDLQRGNRGGRADRSSDLLQGRNGDKILCVLGRTFPFNFLCGALKTPLTTSRT